jgi:imidazolonepropionase-like amidohydrolase
VDAFGDRELGMTMGKWTSMRGLAVAGLAGLACAPAAQAEQAQGTLAIVGATVFDATGAPPRAATVLVKDGRIVAVGAGLAIPKGAQVLKADGEALLPGFFDVHTHWTPGGEPRTTPQIANAYIAAGVTTTDDFNASPESFEPRRRWLAGLAAPHVNFTARMGVPGGHGADWGDQTVTKWVGSAESARAEVRALLPYKPDLIKGFQDGWRYGSGADNNSMDLSTLSALVDEAHKNNIKVLTHTVTVARGKEAARAKVDVIAHSLQDAEIDQETVELMKANGTAYAPTLAVYEPIKPGAKAPAADDPRLKQSQARFGHALHNVKRLHDAGILVALGTDAGMPGTLHGFSSLHEMELLVLAGLTPSEALMAGTANSARALGLDKDRGTIEPGKRADLVLIKGAPWAEIADVRKTDRVLVDGVLVYGPGATPPAANAATAPPPVKVAALVDDFEGADGRTRLDTLRMDDPDRGPDRSAQVSAVIDRPEGGHALAVAASMAQKGDPGAGVILPLTRGSIQPADVRAFHGVRFDIRGGAGAYALSLNTLHGRWTADVAAGAAWASVEVPFTALKRAEQRGPAAAAAWSGDDVVEVELTGSAPAGRKVWMQVDNVRFY